MPQQSLFGGWAITDITIDIHLNANRPGGRVHAVVKDENGKRVEAFQVAWQKDRDIADMGMFAKAIVEAWLWGEFGAVSSVVRVGARAWLPEVPWGE